jgi:nucleoside-diphosphate-sugar epimerase
LLLHAATDTAASAHEDKEALFKGLLTSAQQMCSFCEQAGVQRLLLTGSGAQFGSISPEWSTTGVPDDAAIACDPTLPSSAYGEGKRVTELLAALHAQRTGMAVAYARCFAFVGPELALGGHFAIGNFIRDALAGQPIRLSSTGQALRSYLYGADLALWLLLLLLEAPGGTRVNVGSDASLSVLELAQQVRTVLNPALALRVNAQQPGEERQSYWPAITQARQQRLEVWTPLPLAIQRTAEWVQHCRLRR